MARTSATYQRRNQLAQSRGFKNYSEQRKAVAYLKTGAWAQGWRDVFGTDFDFRGKDGRRIGRLAGEYWNEIVSGQGDRSRAFQVIAHMRQWLEDHDWRVGYQRDKHELSDMFGDFMRASIAHGNAAP